MDSSTLRTLAIFVVIIGGLGILFRAELEKIITGRSTSAAAAVLPDPDALNSIYSRLKMKPLPDSTARIEPVAAGLKGLNNSLCDKKAIFKFSNALLAAGESRAAAQSFLGFSEACPNSEGELNAGFNILFDMGDYAAALPVADKLVQTRPELAQLYYVRARTFHALSQYKEAAEDFSTAIALMDNLKLVRENVFTYLSSAYVSMGKYCEAMAAIQTYVALDPSTRDTAATRKLLSDYAAKGKCETGYAEGAITIPRASRDVMIVRVSINGVPGNFIVDTGASVVAVNTSFADTAKLSIANARNMKVHTASGVVDAKLTTADLVEMGKVRSRDVAVALLDKPIGDQIDGLLGMSFLARFDVTIGEREMTIKARTNATASP